MKLTIASVSDVSVGRFHTILAVVAVTSSTEEERSCGDPVVSKTPEYTVSLSTTFFGLLHVYYLCMGGHRKRDLYLEEVVSRKRCLKCVKPTFSIETQDESFYSPEL